MSFIHSFITQSCGRSSRALWTALCSSIHVAPPTLVLIDQQHANKGIHVAQFDSCGLGLGGTHTDKLSSSLSLYLCHRRKTFQSSEETDVTQVCD